MEKKDAVKGVCVLLWLITAIIATICGADPVIAFGWPIGLVLVFLGIWAVNTRR